MIESIGLTIIFFFAFQSFFWFLINVYLSIPLNLYSLLLTSFFALLLCFMLFFPRGKLSIKYSGLNPKSLIPLIYLFIILGLNLTLNYYWPVSTEFDAVANYDYRARAFYHTGHITDLYHQYLVSYPLFTSLGHTFMYVLGFANPKPFYSILFWGFLLVFYSRLKPASSPSMAILGCLMLATTPAVFHFAGIAYTNFPYLVFLGGAFLYLSAYLRLANYRNLLIFSLLLGFSAWVRPATHIFFLGNLLLLTLWRRKIFWLPVIIYGLVFLPWWYFQQYKNVISTYEADRVFQSLPVFIQSTTLVYYPIQAAARILLDLKYSGLIGIIFLFTVFKKFRPSPEILVLFVNFLVWLILSLAIRAEYTELNQWISILYDSMKRLFIIFYPIIILIVIKYQKE